jgi:hypothetical protein
MVERQNLKNSRIDNLGRVYNFHEKLHSMETHTHQLFQLWWFLLWSNKEDGFLCLLGHIFAMKPTTMDTLSHEANWEHF